MGSVRVNGVLGGALDPLDRGLAYGDGLFETIAARSGEPRFLAEHLERLAAGCTQLGLPPPDAGLLSKELRAEAAAIGHGTLKLILTRGSGERGYRPPADAVPTRVLFAWPGTPAAPAAGPGIIRARRCRTLASRQPALAGLKTLNRLDQVLARAEWRDAAIAEGLMGDEQGLVVGGTQSNLFVVQAGVVHTPRLDHAGIHGVMRRKVLEAATAAGMAVREDELTWDDLAMADELFVTNALTGIRALAALDSRSLAAPGPLTRVLWQALKDRYGVGECEG